MWQSAAIRSIYQPRGNLAQLFAQQRQYGYWRSLVLRKHGALGSWRQLVPATFVAVLTALLLTSPWVGLVPLALLLGVYGLYLAAVSSLVAGDAGWGLLWRLPVVVAAYHVGYGLGTWQGLFAIAAGRKPSPVLTELTR